ncbi:hypothetical protein IDH09_05130 [Pelagibacterales bacterium SAG-MED28]|jgi:hypothetical protein|nr:hypothetical protein [Pelagibacterales bacterium SAG-MED28]|tara:strand:- start:274 stop:444 length:171 start_codon:yes stop_codon:yes gene_type:complete
MAKIVKETMATASLVVTEIYPDEEAAAVSDGSTVEDTKVNILEYKIENTKWKKYGE